MRTATQSYSQGVVLVLLATLGWSLSGLFVRLLPGLTGWQINCWRGYWMAVSLLVYLLAVYGVGAFRKFRDIPAFALVACSLFFAVGSTLYVTSLTLASTAAVSVIVATSPIFTGLLSPWTTGERPGPSSWAAAVLALAGVAVVAWQGLGGGNPAGVLIAMCVPLSFSAQTLTLRRYSNLDMVPAICVGGFVTFLIAGVAGGGFDVPLPAMALISVMGLVQLAVPLVFYARGARSVAAITLSLIVMLDVVLNPLWPWLIVGETPETAAFIGGAVIVGAVVIAIFGGRWMARATN
jgi:drug/metabolite transporter (DMT)-like permease